MAYQNVGTPRFYIDLLSHNQSIGNIDKIFIKNDSGDTIYANTSDGDDFLFDLINLNPETINPIELLQENDLDNIKAWINSHRVWKNFYRYRVVRKDSFDKIEKTENEWRYE